VVAVMENGQSIIYMIHANEGVYRFAFFKGENLMDYGHCSLHKCWHNVSDTLDQGSIDYLKEKLKKLTI
jgi:hypothetical protein